MSTGPQPFDPERYLVKLKGKDYLEVKWRLRWFRLENPNGLIKTELIEHYPAEGLAVFRCQVYGQNGGEAWGWGQETRADFTEYLEKAETKAIGRALGALGYGTQFTDDFDFERVPIEGRATAVTEDGADAPIQRVVDTPAAPLVNTAPPPAAANVTPITDPGPPGPVANRPLPPGTAASSLTQQQQIHMLAQRAGLERVKGKPDRLMPWLQKNIDPAVQSTKDLNVQEADRVIANLQTMIKRQEEAS